MRPRHLAPLALLVLTGHLACGPDPTVGAVSASAARLTAPNGLMQNSLSSNALFQNALFQNSLMQNSLMQNSLMQNSLMQNGLLSGVLWQDALWQQSPAALEALRANANTRDLLKYTYECAMGPAQSTVLDPGPGGANLELHGLVGLAPGWGQPGGACDESCQRWVTACVLARTNAYGVKVDLSLRVPDDAPAHVKAALAVTDEERAAYPLREGAFYGNLFRQVGQPDGTAVMAPRFYACAGPGSNIPQVTKRFCSSQGAGGPIEVPGTCEAREGFPYGACLGISGDPSVGAMTRCFTNVYPSSSRTEYKEVITVYLKRPIEVCGNSVCEENEATEKTCPSDCHPEGWARSFTSAFEGSLPWKKTSAIGQDDSIILAGVAPSTIDLGGGQLDSGPDGAMRGALAKYGPGGEHQWSKRFGPLREQSETSSVAVASDGSIVVALEERGGDPDLQGSMRVWLDKFTPGGLQVWSRSFGGLGLNEVDALATDGDGNIIVAGSYTGQIKFGHIVLPGVEYKKSWYAFVLKASPEGEPLWAVHLGEVVHLDRNVPTSLAVDPDGNVLLGLKSDVVAAGLWKLSAASGAVLWSRRGWHGGVAVAPSGDVYATGSLAATNGSIELVDQDTYDFPLPPAAKGGDFFVAEYAAADGAPLRSRVVTPACHGADPPCGGKFEGRDISLDAAGNVVVGVLGGNNDAIDFGAGPFRMYGTDDAFVVAFSPALEPLWAKHVPMILDGSVHGLKLNSQGRVVISGAFAGSMQVDDRLLVSHIPEQAEVDNTFLAAFAAPPAADVTPPLVVEAHVPKPMTIEATSVAGAEVFYLPPTSTDAGNAGVGVTCSPPPNTVFPIGTTTVTCAATDPLGNATTESFEVKVVDHLGPSFGNVPTAVTAGATSPAGAIVTYDPPSAVDLVDGDRAVACSPASGSAFALGTTMVTCGAEDAKGVLTTVSFPVHVRYGGESCGNGTLDPGEECDDGNTNDGDGCASSCALENRAPDCSGPSASPAFLLASTGQMWAPVSIDGVSDPDGDPVTISAIQVWQDEPVSTWWCPGGTCADATLEPLTVRTERDTWAPTDPQPDGRVYHINFRAVDSHGAQCVGLVKVCVQRRHDVMSCGDGGPLYNSLAP